MTLDESDLPGPEEDPGYSCPLEGTMRTLSAKYAIQVVCTVGAYGVARFSEVEAAVPDASTSTLSARLDELTEAGLVRREQYDEVPPRVEYRLTADGEELCERLVPLLEWARQRDA